MGNSQLAACIFRLATRSFIFLNTNSQLATRNSHVIKSQGISIISATGLIGVPAGIISASFTIVFSLTTGIIKKLLKITRKKKKKHNKIVILAKSKLNSIETLMSQALIDLDISHDEFKTIANEKEKYQQMK